MFSKPEPIVEDNLEDSPVKYNESFIIKPGKTNSIWVDGNEKVPQSKLCEDKDSRLVILSKIFVNKKRLRREVEVKLQSMQKIRQICKNTKWATNLIMIIKNLRQKINLMVDKTQQFYF